MLNWKVLFSVATLLLLISCFNSSKTSSKKTYLALGDSYTIGESVDVAQRWPVQLQQMLIKNGYEVDEPRIIAKTGWRTDDLISAINAEKLNAKYDMVSLLIGVNNQYQGREIEQYEKEFKELLEIAIGKSKKGAAGVFILSIPDYGVSPFARNRNPEKIGEEIDMYNKIAGQIAEQYQVKYIDITEISRQAKKDRELIANDKLHPSAKMYALWVKRAFPTAESIMSK